MWRTSFGRCIYTSPNKINIYDNGLFRWLTFQTQPIQSLIFKPNPSYLSLEYIYYFTLLPTLEPGKTALLGIGGGSAIHRLLAYMPIEWLAAIDISDEIIHIAQQYFYLNKFKDLALIQKDAYAFVKENQSCYRYVLVDLFDSVSFPIHCLSIDFFANCKQCLADNGLLVINFAHHSEQKKATKYLRAVFCQNTVAISLKNSANIIVLAAQESVLNRFIDILITHKKLTQYYWDADWGRIAVLR